MSDQSQINLQKKDFEDRNKINLYPREEEGLIGLKPATKEQSKLAPKTNSKEFVVSCTPTILRMSMEEIPTE